MIRARFDSPWHDYRNVFDDLRNGKLSMEEYDTMVSEDALEGERRRAGLVVAVDALDNEDEDCNGCIEFAERVTVDAGIKEEIKEEVYEDIDTGLSRWRKASKTMMPVSPLKVAITLDDSDEDITHCISLKDNKAVILIRNEPSGAY